MSSDYSSFERDYFRRPKKREDIKSSKISPKQIKVYEPKSAQNSIKTQGYADDSEQSSCYEHNYYLNYTQSAKKKNERSYAYQARSSSGKKQRGSNKFKALRKDEEMNQDTEEPHKDKTFKHDIIWVPASKTKIPSPLAERSGVDNKSNPPALSPEVEHPLWEDSLMRSPGQSTAATLNNSKSMELFNFSQDRPDPIQILKASLKKERQKKVDIVSESPENAAGNKEEKRLEKDHQGEIQENDGTNYSDIDNLVEEKLLNNQAELDLQDDISNHLELEQKEVYLVEDLENKERPVWEDIDTQQVLEDIKTQTILPTKIKSAEVPQSDNFDHFFSFEIREEPMAVEPDIFNFNMKFSSDKQPRAKHLQNDNSLCSQSFDMELIDRRKSHYKPLPAFRNFCIQKGTSDENVSKNYSLPIDHSISNTSPNNMNFPPQIFCDLIPNIHVKVWFYLDLESILQGPFSSQVMDGWYSKGYLPLNLDITIKNGRSFRKIKDLMEIVLSQRCAGYLPLLSTQNSNLHHTPKVYQDNMDLDETEKEINNSIENIISENCCPNVRRTFRQNSAPETLKAFSDRSQVPLSKNQSQGFDNRFSYNNATYLRNLPR